MKTIFTIVLCGIFATSWANLISYDPTTGKYVVDQYGAPKKAKKKIPREKDRGIGVKKNPFGKKNEKII